MISDVYASKKKNYCDEFYRVWFLIFDFPMFQTLFSGKRQNIKNQIRTR